MPKTSTAASATTAAPRAKRARRATTLGRRARRAATSGVGHEQIAVRAYEIHLSDAAGGPLDHWLAAERELAGA
jgi:hypothetical protein